MSTIFDLFNNEIVAYQISDRNDMQLVLDTVKKAKSSREVKETLLHSDQGFQYTSRTFTNQLEEFNMRPSMSRKGNCWDNACMESFFGHLKAECIYLNSFHTESELKQAIDQYIYFYNNERFQKKLGNVSPVEYRTNVA